MQQSGGEGVGTADHRGCRAGCGHIGGGLDFVEPDDSSRPAHPLRHIVEGRVGQVFGILADDFDLVTRGPARVALARQVAMYLAHVTCRHTFTEVGRIFSRDRTTVAHACGVVEDLRDDRRFDRVLDLLDAIVRHQVHLSGDRCAHDE